MNEENAVYALKQVKKVLEKEDMEFWLDTGTLLGAVREGKIIPWDEDIDLGMWEEDLNEVKRILHHLPDEIQGWYDGQEVIMIYRDCVISITLYGSDERDGLAKRYYNVERNYLAGLSKSISKLMRNEEHATKVSKNIPVRITKVIAKILSILPSTLQNILRIGAEEIHDTFSSRVTVGVPVKYFEDLSKMEFYDMIFYVPSPVEDYLQFRYGEEWKTPKKDYVYYEDDKSIVGDEESDKVK